jgi:pimeloyl-ACP methyl ester carboxylesterase
MPTSPYQWWPAALSTVMAGIDELVALGSAALALPGVLRRRSCAAVRHPSPYESHRPEAAVPRQPVVLVHGYAGTDAVWSPLRHRLAEAGFDHVVSLSYNSIAADVPTLAAEVAEHARAAQEATAAAGVHLVGHSFGGLVARYAVARRLWATASTVVTIGTPHGGAPFARFGPGRCARHMHPGSPLLAFLCGPAPATRARWVAYYSDTDRVVPPWSARLTDPRLAARNVLVPGCGHLTMCRDPRLLASVVSELLRSEALAGAPAAGRPVPPAVRRPAALAA